MRLAHVLLLVPALAACGAEPVDLAAVANPEPGPDDFLAPTGESGGPFGGFVRIVSATESRIVVRHPSGIFTSEDGGAHFRRLSLDTFTFSYAINAAVDFKGGLSSA